jgi:acyl-CoA thioester hydrolase
MQQDDDVRPIVGDGSKLLFFAPFVSSVMRLKPEWIDYNGHLNVAWHNTLFDRATDEAFALCGLTPAYPRERGFSYFVVEARLRYRRELTLSDPARVTLQLLAVDDKRLHYCMELRHAEEGWVASTAEHLAVHVNMASRKAAPFPDDIRANLESMRASHSLLAPPDFAGEGVAMPSRPRMN